MLSKNCMLKAFNLCMIFTSIITLFVFQFVLNCCTANFGEVIRFDEEIKGNDKLIMKII